jgi:hypothetical protein
MQQAPSPVTSKAVVVAAVTPIWETIELLPSMPSTASATATTTTTANTSPIQRFDWELFREQAIIDHRDGSTVHAFNTCPWIVNPSLSVKVVFSEVRFS